MSMEDEVRKDMGDLENRYRIEKKDEWRKWMEEIPYIQFPANWSIKIIPPFTGAIVRFRAKLGKKDVSIYLDCYDRLGHFGSPYWEVYPYQDDIGRCGIDEVGELLRMIKDTLEGK